MEKENKSSLFERMKTMTIEELLSYKTSAKIAGRICAISGILNILLMLIFPNILVYLTMGISLYCFAKLSIGIDIASNHVQDLLDKKVKAR